MSSIGTAIHDSVALWLDNAQLLRSAWDHVSNHLVTAALELGEHITGRSLPPSMGPHFLPGMCEALAIEQTQFEQQQCWESGHSPLMSPPLSEPYNVAGLCARPAGTILPALNNADPLHIFPYQDQHISPPIYG